MAATELLKACRSGDEDRARAILASSHAQLSQKTLNEGLVDAGYYDHRGIAGLLLSHGAKITEFAIRGACSHANADLFQHFINHGFDVNMVVQGDPVLRYVGKGTLGMTHRPLIQRPQIGDPR